MYGVEFGDLHVYKPRHQTDNKTRLYLGSISGVMAIVCEVITLVYGVPRNKPPKKVIIPIIQSPIFPGESSPILFFS